jgi:phytoene synthase
MPTPSDSGGPRSGGEVRPDDLAHCAVLLAKGSKSFSAASTLLPRRVRVPATVLYAFCRVADDAVDDCGADREAAAAALEGLHRRLDRIEAHLPDDHPVDRALAEVVHAHDLPVEALRLLLDGFRWDVEGKQYDGLTDVIGYSVRVASTVGVLMTALMGPRDLRTMARACDLGVAMQLTNIARDVGEDARNGRVYLPTAWLEDAGVDRAALLASPTPGPALGAVVERLLDTAATYYRRADDGITRLPRGARIAIRAASLIYADIGRVIRENGYDSVTRRAFTTKGRKAWLLLRAFGAVFWRRRPADQPIDDEARPLVVAAARAPQASLAAPEGARA